MIGPALPPGQGADVLSRNAAAAEAAGQVVVGCSADAASPTAMQPRLPQLKMHWQEPLGVGCGLRNLGNSCFLNSVLQSLTYLPPLGNLCRASHHRTQCLMSKAKRQDQCAYCLLEKRIKRSLETKVTDAPNWIFNRLGTLFAKHLVRGRQEDAHEFLRCLLDAVERALLEPTYGPRALSGPKVPETEVSYLFGGMLQSQVKCKSCGTESNTYDPFHDLSLELRQCASLDEALELFTAPEHLAGDNAYSCGRCKRKSEACKRMTIHEAPNVLVIHFKRFDGVFGGKITRNISFSERLSLTDFLSSCSPDRPISQPFGASSADSQRPPPDYSLCGVLVHDGFSARSGHYYTCIKNAEGHWYEMNDSRVQRLRPSDVLNEEAYLLFYVRTGTRPPKAYQNIPAMGTLDSSMGQHRQSPARKRSLSDMGGSAALPATKYSRSCDSDESVCTVGPAVLAPDAPGWLPADDASMPELLAVLPALPAEPAGQKQALQGHASNGHAQPVQHIPPGSANLAAASISGPSDGVSTGLQPAATAQLANGHTRPALSSHSNGQASQGVGSRQADVRAERAAPGGSPASRPTPPQATPVAATPLQQPGYMPSPAQQRTTFKAIRIKPKSRGRMMASMVAPPSGQASAAQPSGGARPLNSLPGSAASPAVASSASVAARPPSSSAAGASHAAAVRKAAALPARNPLISVLSSEQSPLGASVSGRGSTGQGPSGSSHVDEIRAVDVAIGSSGGIDSTSNHAHVMLPQKTPQQPAQQVAGQSGSASAPPPASASTASQAGPSSNSRSPSGSAAEPASPAGKSAGAAQASAQAGRKTQEASPAPALPWAIKPGRHYTPEPASKICAAVSASAWVDELRSRIRSADNGAALWRPLDEDAGAKQAILDALRPRLPAEVKGEGCRLLREQAEAAEAKRCAKAKAKPPSRLASMRA